jgi:tryptophanyl-tRNA synthetase
MGDPIDPDTDTVFQLFRLFGHPDEVEELRNGYVAGEIGYGKSKEMLRNVMSGYFEPYRARREELTHDSDFVEDVLQEGAKRARAEARITVDRVREIVGLSSASRVGAAK